MSSLALLPGLRTPAWSWPRSRRDMLVLAVAALLALIAVMNIAEDWPRGPYFEDYQGFVAAGRAQMAGLNPYGDYPYLPGVTDGPWVPWPEGSPPPALFVFRAFAAFDLTHGAQAWFVISLAFYGLLLALLWKLARRPLSPLFVAWSLALPAFLSTLYLGQIYVALACLAAGAWLAARSGRRVLAGVLVGLLIAIKPNFAVWPVALIVSGQAAIGLAALATGASLAVLALAVFGPEVFNTWLFHSAVGFTNGWRENGSVFAIGNLLHNTSLNRPIGLSLAALLCSALLIWAWRARPTFDQVSGLSIVVALLAAPLAFMGYLVLALPLFVGRRWRLSTYASAIILLIPEPPLAALCCLGASEILQLRNTSRGAADEEPLP